MLRRRLAQKLRYQRAQSGRILRSGQAGRDLHVEQPLGPTVDRLQAELEFAAAGVNDRFVPRRGDGLPKRRHVADRDRVDHRQFAVGGHLDQTQHRPVGVFRHEFGVECDALGQRKLAAILPQLLVGGDIAVLHG